MHCTAMPAPQPWVCSRRHSRRDIHTIARSALDPHTWIGFSAASHWWKYCCSVVHYYQMNIKWFLNILRFSWTCLIFIAVHPLSMQRQAETRYWGGIMSLSQSVDPSQPAWPQHGRREWWDECGVEVQENPLKFAARWGPERKWHSMEDYYERWSTAWCSEVNKPNSFNSVRSVLWFVSGRIYLHIPLN